MKRSLALCEVSSEGDVTESSLVAREGKLLYEEVIYAADASTLPVRAEAVREGEDAFTFKARAGLGGEWKEVFETTWRRVR